ncbi:Sec-independent protein translocase subunit TatA/TatB [Pontibacter burrus]|uniref:Sec-independent protein translocase protein TatA n=1 Tax=Pontibacter burrus TaxID=2704466 RepID=A0A6B3LRR3_9BACT|nr:twin-arginine translocase TatA/TatE family subunit [Pontibacter burrus]NEM96886.1 twin-arginine translocase TatA/TatE family subunit [Pontibacter burrus]
MSITTIFCFLPNLGGTELILIMLAILLFFGAKRIPELARGLGKGIREFKDATKEIKSEVENSVNDEPAKK